MNEMTFPSCTSVWQGLSPRKERQGCLWSMGQERHVTTMENNVGKLQGLFFPSVRFELFAGGNLYETQETR